MIEMCQVVILDGEDRLLAEIAGVAVPEKPEPPAARRGGMSRADADQLRRASAVLGSVARVLGNMAAANSAMTP